MPNIVIPNTLINTSNEKFHAFWKLTRGLLAAGWRYKASSDTFQKETTGDSSKDLWSVGGYTNLTGLAGQTGSVASISNSIVATGTAPPDIKLTGTPVGVLNFNIQITTGGARGTAIFKWSSDGGNTFTTTVTTAATTVLGATGITINWPVGTYTADNVWTTSSTHLTLTGLTGMTANSVGHAITLSGAFTAANNGTYRIASFISSSSVTVYNPFAAGLTAYQNAGIAASITTFASPTVTITGVANMTAASVGRYITITGASSAGNSGTFLITAFISATSVSYSNASGVATDANNPNIHWVESLVSATPAASAPYVDSASGVITWTEKAGGVIANVTTVTNGIATLTGLTGMTTSSVGHRITLINAASSGNNGTFMIVEYVSAVSVKISNASAVASDGNNGLIHWVERDPALDSYPLDLSFTTVNNGAGSWFCIQGPSTMKFPIGTSNPSPPFIRGEKVTQAATGCEGEILGVVVDATGGTGFIVVAPRVNGSGGNARGWDTSAISAVALPAGSGATVTPSAAGIEYVREIVIWKNLLNTGHIYYQCIDQLGEATPGTFVGRFSTMAALTQCTPTICPGGATGLPTVNGFPTLGTMVWTGTGGSGAVATGSNEYGSVNNAVSGMIQVICANCIEAAGVSQDGTFSILLGTPASTLTSYNLNGFLRLDDGEEGDVDPYIAFWPNAQAVGARTRTVNTSATTGNDWAQTGGTTAGSQSGFYLGFRRRGFSTGDSFGEFSGWGLNGSSNSTTAIGLNFQAPETVACTFAVQSPRIREPIWIASYLAGQKMRKGTIRWWYNSPGGNAGDTLDGKRWAQFSSTLTAAGCATVIGPWDGITNSPLNA